MKKRFAFGIKTFVTVISILFTLSIVITTPGMAFHRTSPVAMSPDDALSGTSIAGLPTLEVQLSRQLSAHPTIWTARAGLSSVVLSDGSIVIMGGSLEQDVWSSTDQGATWTQINIAAPWGRRQYHTSVVLSDDSIILMGGELYKDGVFTLVNDVWRSTDKGVSWTPMTTAAPWNGRRHMTSVVLSDNSIVLMGGEDSRTAYDKHRNDVWRSTDNGATWTMMTDNAEWGFRSMHSSVVLFGEDGDEDSIVLMGGIYQETLGGVEHISNQVWRSTDQGATWEEICASAPWSARYLQANVVLSDGSIILIGGVTAKRDVWRSTDFGQSWTLMTDAAEWGTRQEHSSVVLPDDSIVILGGKKLLDYSFITVNEVWRSTDYGATWTKMIAPVSDYTIFLPLILR